MGYEAEWLDSNLIPSFLLEHFQSTGSTSIPYPSVMSSTSTGNITYKTLTWKPTDDLLPWVQDNSSTFPGFGPEESGYLNQEEVPLTCNTKKDKDTRFHRHTAGIFIGTRKKKN